MATITFEYYGSSGPAWTDIGANKIIFAGTGGLATSIAVGSYQDETHIGNGDPGTDQCGANHALNVKYISGTQFDNGGGTETLNDTNLTANECTLRLHFNDASAVTVSAPRLFAWDGTTESDPALNCNIWGFEQGVSGTTWTQIGNGTTIGGDNTSERLDLAGSASATDHYWYIALSMSPTAVGDINAMDFKMYLTYS